MPGSGLQNAERSSRTESIWLRREQKHRNRQPFQTTLPTHKHKQVVWKPKNKLYTLRCAQTELWPPTAWKTALFGQSEISRSAGWEICWAISEENSGFRFVGQGFWFQTTCFCQKWIGYLKNGNGDYSLRLKTQNPSRKVLFLSNWKIKGKFKNFLKWCNLATKNPRASILK